MNLLSKDKNGCPYLQLAPMEGVGDACFRKAMASLGGFDEAVRDFLRVPKNAHIKSLAKVYDPHEIAPIPLAAQIMGSDSDLMAQMAYELEKMGAPRIDLNCGCPSNTVTGRGSGSSLLKNPSHLHEIASLIAKTVSIPVTIKMRIGYEDTLLFKENLLAAEASGAKYITLHARTKADGYLKPARWEYIAQAKSILKIPVVGNGDILTVEDAVKMLTETGCDGLMIGRGSIINPFIFHQIRAFYAKNVFKPQWQHLESYLECYFNSFEQEVTVRLQINKLKQLLGFLFKSTPILQQKRQSILTANYPDARSYLNFAKDLLQEGFI